MPCDFYSSSVSLVGMNTSLGVCCTDWLWDAFSLLPEQEKIFISSFPWRKGKRMQQKKQTVFRMLSSDLEWGAVAYVLSCYQGLNCQSIKAVAKFSEKKKVNYMLAANQIFKCSSGKRGFQSKCKYCCSNQILSRTLKKKRKLVILIQFSNIQPK